MKRVAVIGAGFGGLSAAAELASAGHRVTLFEKSDTLGGKAQVVSSSGVTLDTGPTLLTMPDVVRGLFARIGASDLLPTITRLSFQARYTWKDDARTFECHEELERTVASAAQFGPKEADGARSFYAEAEKLFAAAGAPYLEAPFENMPQFLSRVLKHVGPLGMLAGMKLATLDGLACSHFQSPQLRQFVNRFATYAGCSPYLASAAFALIPHLERAQGVHHVTGGMGALVTAFGKALERLNVEVRLGEEIDWSGLVVADQKFDAVIVNADPFAKEPLGSRPLALSGYVALLDIRRRLPLAHHHVVFGGDYVREFDELFEQHTVPSDPTIYFCHPAATDPTLAPEGRSGLFAMVNAPAMRRSEDVDAWKQQYASAMRAHCLKSLKQLVPGLRDDELTVLSERTPVELAQRGAPGGSIYGFLPHGKFGPFQRPKIKTTTPGVFFAGGSTHPGGGVPMVMLSGHFAAAMASAFLGTARAAA